MQSTPETPPDFPRTKNLPNEICVTLARRLQSDTQGEILFDDASRGRYSTDASIYQITPVGVFVPRSELDIATAIAIARDLNVPILARGGGTSQCGQTVGAALIIDNTKYFNRILDCNTADRIITVEPGIVLDHLNAELKKHDLWYPVDVSTSAQATLGGMAGNNSCGSRSIAYGNMVHNVHGMSAWLSDGELVDFGPVSTLGLRGRDIAEHVHGLAKRLRTDINSNWPKVTRRVAGYNLDIFDCQSERPYTADGSVNLAHLLIGSEGTLAYTRSLTLKLSERPKATVLGIVNFPTFHSAMNSAQHIVKLGPTAVELVDRTMIELALANPSFRATVETAVIGKPAAILLVEFSGNSKEDLLLKLNQLDELMGDLGLPRMMVEMAEETAQKNLWAVRKAGLNIMMSLKGDGKPISFIEDCAVPLEHLAEYTDALTEVFAKHGSRGTWYAHASVGTLHVRPILDMRTDGAAKMRLIAEETAALVRKYKGAFSGEHGDGLCRGEWIEWQFGPAINDAFRSIKNKLDPINLFNPGKIIDPPRMDDGSLFRFAPPSAPKPYGRIPIATSLDWSEWNVQADPLTEVTTAPGTGGDETGGFAKAIEMCNNNGHCRKFDAGTMCPSYRVTRDEQHLTRGRANTLRLAISGQLGSDAFTSDAVYQAMDLCVSCKGCKRDCPTGVDMAKMKIEFLDHYKRKNGHTLKDHLVASLPDYAKTASLFPWLFNLRNTVPGAKWLSEKTLGFSAKRSLPKWRSDTFWRTKDNSMFLSAAETIVAARAGQKTAVLFVDTFNGTFESENAFAAARVLRHAGYILHTVEKDGGHYCCGRTYLATGMVKQAKAKAGALIEALYPLAKAGCAIVGLEPSCLLTLRDEALVMGLGDQAKIVAQQAMLFEEFISREIKAGRWQLALKAATKPILLHGHCHQKAFDAVQPILEVLRQIPGANPELIQSSCCGMAGSFGYEASHYDVSMQMAEVSLLPTIRSHPEAIVVADGTSCRHQIADGTAREAIHIARLLDSLLS
ncbi:FAD-binding and (Fe-S)-binding domain-containing protein [Pusillimonas sp. ANT_WB101]|uniref:FAD-binding and (Fe-S)-binding domain-containing protein n=1 Tax=Pusillimonas sp. ANT_WB101 TaxID=2597356 RepID=UPI0011EEC16A|nr:FAD-binding and (Fe-S)-binding domain-containing protein [Pusillimonas sp. ANT_WB101]KAA0890314.1 FAD-binding protein [Pusillimonas sp. ANT_WB101]